ncbi:hydrogenase-2 assembly chaperone [Edwardsiella ictaluri]|nr:hydrogenase-2 assembly chaperone [Edwardsiella ictaluri]ARD38882.1 hydrogenase biosynthesis protein HybE [Edwardsiella ictaluri]AVZ83227.1 hydrogenase-2 assembly chaperone [Edwardsiella ictaluri]EKS7761899.1 hydrogenase-2 assembly chaperone [Edwardsiella ictaluri]EKS7768709.1 hydrogenase-2 assembly chaperone [Edwardsiella ictaluri]EKS7771973.1 hydrogenase-2 assembly chaperone [Edwardsiella ictaluri]
MHVEFPHDEQPEQGMVAGRLGFDSDPAAQLIAQYQQIAAGEMHSLPFYRVGIPVSAVMRPFDGQWIGCVLTPWMLSVVILPGPGQVWPVRKIGDRLALQLPRGNMTFMIGELPQSGQLLSCSLMSPLDPHLEAEQAEQLMHDTLTMLLSLPVAETHEVDLSRRALFSRRG